MPVSALVDRTDGSMNIETFMVVGLCADDACVSNMRCLMARNVLKTRSLRVAAQHLAQQTGTFSNASPLAQHLAQQTGTFSNASPLAQHLAQQTGTFSNASPLGLLNRLSDHCSFLTVGFCLFFGFGRLKYLFLPGCAYIFL